MRDAINARTKRALRNLFPDNDKHVTGISSDGKTPHTQLALLEHYIRTTDLKSVVRSDLIAGDVTGQWNLMVDWTKSVRVLKRIVKRNPIVEGIETADGFSEIGDLELTDITAEPEEELEEEEIFREGPEVIDFATEDLAVVPPTCNDLQKARAVAVRLRMSAAKVQEMVDEGVFILPPGSDIEAFCEPDKSKDRRPPPKQQTNDAGVKTEGTDKYAVVFQVYQKLDLGGDRKEEAIVYYASPVDIIGIIRNPLWSGKRPIISEPVERIAGSFFGKSKIEPVKFIQWNLCDFWNMGQDSAMYSLLPVMAADPLKVTNWASLVLGLAAVWPIGPDSIKPIPFPPLWKDAMSICQEMKRQIWESMDVNEMMMGKMPQGRKNNQLMGQMQQEQQTNIVDHASRYEQAMLHPLVEMLFEFDQQFRTRDLEVEQRGEIGAKAKIEAIPPQQWGEKYFFRWSGTEAMANLQRMQQQIAWVNVIKGVPPQMLSGRRLDMGPFLEMGTENIFGPELAPRILVDERNLFQIDPETENEILFNGMDVEVHPGDDDTRHIQSHMRAGAMSGDPMGLFKKHMGGHMMQMQKKRQMQMGQAQQGGLPGGPGGAGPGVAGAPRPGAMPAAGGPRTGQNPAGAINPDQMAGVPGRG